jgi:hypothetical protein
MVLRACWRSGSIVKKETRRGSEKYGRHFIEKEHPVYIVQRLRKREPAGHTGSGQSARFKCYDCL